MVIGQRAAVEGVLDRQESGDGSGPTDPVVTAAMDRVGFGQAGIAGSMRVTEAIVRDLEVPAMLSSSLESAAFALTLDEGLRAAVVVKASSTFVAVALATLGRGQIGELARSPEVVALGLQTFVSAIAITSEGNEAWARVELTPPDVEALAASVSRILGAEP
jgi:hypothetical protein